MLEVVRNQLQGDVTEKNFEVGYLQGTTVVSVRTNEDLAEVWGNIQNGSNVTLWCDGLKVRDGASKRKQAQETYSDERRKPTIKKERR